MPLERFGFTRTQDTVYKALLQFDAATGYAVARATGLARANVYQALDALVARGLARTSGGRPATYRAVAAGAAIAVLAKRMDAELKALESEFDVPHHARGRDGGALAPNAERLEGREALLAAATDSVDSAVREVLAVVGPWVPSIVESLVSARRRGVAWRVVSLGTPAPEGAAVRPVSPADLTAYWGGMPVALLADRTLAVCGIVAEGRTEGIRTTSPALVPFLRHLLRRELATAAAPRVS